MPDMDDGYYWYLPRLHEDIPDLSERQIVLVHHGDMVSLCGSDVGYNVDECRGTFSGPLNPPTAHGERARMAPNAR